MHLPLQQVLHPFPLNGNQITTLKRFILSLGLQSFTIPTPPSREKKNPDAERVSLVQEAAISIKIPGAENKCVG